MVFDIRKELDAAKPGATVFVPSGSYGSVALSRKALGEAVTIAAQDPANPPRLSSLTISNAQDLIVRGLSVQLVPDAKTVASTSVARVVASQGVRLQGLTLRGGRAIAGIAQDADPNVPRSGFGDSIIGLPIGRGLTLDRSTEIVVQGCDIGESHKGIVLNNLSGVKIVGNNVHDVRTGTISGAGCSEIDVIENHLKNSRPWNYGGKGDHGDFIHFWTTTAKPSSSGIRILRNLIDQGEGAPIMGILMEDNGHGGFLAGEIVDNLILTGNGQGIAATQFNGRITGNRMMQTEGTAKQGPSILLRAGVGPDKTKLWGEAIVEGNKVHDVYGTLAKKSAGGRFGGNTVLAARPASAPVIAAARRDWLSAYRPKMISSTGGGPYQEAIVIELSPERTVVIRGLA